MQYIGHTKKKGVILMKSKINLTFRVLSVVFSLLALISFALPFATFRHESLNGIEYIGAAASALALIFAWVYFTLICAGLAFILSLGNLIIFKFRGIATGVFSLCGFLFMIGFLINSSTHYYHNGIGVYVCTVALLLALVSSVICIVTHKKTDLDDEPIESMYPPNPLIIK